MTRRGRREQDGKPKSWLSRLGFGWWMPASAAVAPLGFGLFRAFAGDDGVMTEFIRGLWWPGAAIYVVALAAIWAGWTLELE